MATIPPLRGARLSLAATLTCALLAVSSCGSSGSERPATATSTTTASDVAPTSSTVASTTTTGGEVLEITIVDGKVAGGVQRISVEPAQQVTLRITSDVPEELHVHGYDLTLDLEPGEAGELTFTADIPGVFEVELEHSGLPVAEIRVG